MAGHAELSPSKFERIVHCTPSVRLEQQFPDQESEYAMEGTLTHKLGEALIKRDLKMITASDAIRIQDEVMRHKLYQPEIERYAAEYRTYVIEQYSVALSQHPDAKIFIERKLDCSNVHPAIWGTGDVVIVWPGNLHFIDLKYGKGVPVDAEHNEQQMLYACGALREFGPAYKIENVKITIYQPRIDHTNTWTTNSAYLMAWAFDVARPAAEKAMAGTGEFVAGAHCQFCKAKPRCKALAEYNMEIAQEDFKSAELLTAEEVANIILKSSTFTSWIKAVKEYAIQEARSGRAHYPGLKLVEGKADRTYKDEAAIAETLMNEAMYEESEIYKKSLIGITEMEKLLGKQQFKKYIADYVVKPAGTPTLAPLTDKRPAIGSIDKAHDDFKDLHT